MDHLLLVARALLLLGVANGTPIFAKTILKKRFDAPIDFGLVLPDGEPLLGESKTFRGIVVAVACTVLAAPLLGIDWRLGAGIALLSMLGDLASSFVKRRLHLKPHSQAFGLDQLPEALLPLLLFKTALDLTYTDILAVTALFVAFEIVLSRLLFRLKVRDRPW